MTGGISFLVQFLWSSVGFLYAHGCLYFRLGDFPSLVMLKIFTGSLSWKSSFSSIPIFLRVGLLIVY